jgi:hypothetical protein
VNRKTSFRPNIDVLIVLISVVFKASKARPIEMVLLPQPANRILHLSSGSDAFVDVIGGLTKTVLLHSD